MKREIALSFLIICCTIIPTVLHAAAITDDKQTVQRTHKSNLKSTPITKIKLIPSDAVVPIDAAASGDDSELKTPSQKRRKSLTNPELLNKLGLGKLRASSSHHRKRLAVESRRHGRPDDSHMFVIKLPPNPYYYSNNIPMDSKHAVDEKSRKIPVGFKSNGKPGRIYHWNIPVLKKILGNNHGRSPNLRYSDNESELIDIKNIPTWTKPWENDTAEKSLIKYGPNDIAEKIIKKKSPTYYAPVKAKQTNFNKYFPGNGKPQSFYVIEKSLKPIHYHKLIE